MGDVVELNNITKLDLQPERVIRGALEKELTDVVIVGWDPDGEFYFSSSIAAGSETLWLLEIARKRLIEIGDGDG